VPLATTRSMNCCGSEFRRCSFLTWTRARRPGGSRTVRLGPRTGSHARSGHRACRQLSYSMTSCVEARPWWPTCRRSTEAMVRSARLRICAS
jgi:hypothetical protein